ncbi:hypothetical protein BSM4216_0396 [Bacillus smithii]|nr:hypothetical protein BSM4216_0396 [Bacillus smithii]
MKSSVISLKLLTDLAMWLSCGKLENTFQHQFMSKLNGLSTCEIGE